MKQIIDEQYKNMIRDIIMTRNGRSSAIKIDDLMKIIPLSHREIRRVVQYLVNEDKEAIGSTVSSPYGFYKIVSLEDYFHAVKNLFARKEKIMERIKNLEEACHLSGLDIPKTDVKVHKTKNHESIHINNSIVIFAT
jgi:hypothetical protein